MTPAAYLGELLLAARRGGVAFEDAWPAATTTVVAGLKPDELSEWLDAFEATRGAWAATWERRAPSRAERALLAVADDPDRVRADGPPADWPGSRAPAQERHCVLALRFRAYGQRQDVTLGSTADGWTRRKAEAELTLTLAQVERGVWQAPTPAPAAPVVADPTFHEFSSEWFAQHERGWEPHTANTYRGLLSNHLLPHFHEHRLSQITVAEIDRYHDDRLAEGARRDAARAKAQPGPKRPRRLGTTTINKSLVMLGQILSVAEERGLIDRNPLTVNPRRRKAKRDRRRPVYLDSAEHITALLEVAGRLDADPEALTHGRRALIATLVLAGLRPGEACALDWRHVNLADGWLYVRQSKTDAGVRDVKMLPLLRDELLAYKAHAQASGPDRPVFITAAGKRRRVDNARQRVIEPVVLAADELLAERGIQPLPEGVTAHKLRHTAASILAALNRPMPEVIA